ncbi:MAG TPA: serine/threonine-protein kinase [Longimicrobiales bacterium]|nr:serine/threonine-protein kinase [Longimicrobiales bacterium]
MDRERLDRAQALFDAALELDAADRTDFMETMCGADEELRALVGRLLDAHEEAATLGIVSGAIQTAAREWSDGAGSGRLLGPYRLLRELGRGGMGTVWLAERADDAYHAQVAIKIVRGGFADAELARRFRAERQVLADLTHPNIARLLDGGDAPDGTPYLVMEYVDGEAITAYSERRELDLRSRLELFLRVCDAVQHAHASLIVHRDIKPSNILVDADGVPKLVDFGIAKPLAGNADATALMERRLTPSYASPEQIRGERVTVGTDVFSLGVLLYELLTGEQPFGAQASTADQQRRVLEMDPPAASVAVRQRTGSAWSVSGRALQGDLDNIVARSIRKEPEARYPSVRELAEDIGRYVAGQPVLARPATISYRARKFVRRHAGAVAAAAALVLALAGGLGATTWQARRAESARADAVTALAQANVVKDFLTGLFQASDPRATRGSEVTARELLERGVERADELADQPAVQAELLSVLARVQLQLGEYRSAADLTARAVDVRRTLPQGVDSLLVSDMNVLGSAFDRLGQPDTAAHYFREAIALGRPVLGEQHDAVMGAMNNLATSLARQGLDEESQDMYRQVLELQQRVLGPDHIDNAPVYNNLGLQLTHHGQYAEAEPLMRETLRLYLAEFGEDHPNTSFGLDNLAMMLREAGRYDEAEPFARRGLAVRRQVFGPDHRFTGESLFSLGTLLALRGAPGDHVESDSLLSAALVVYHTTLGEDHPGTAYVLHSQGVLAEAQGDRAAAEQKYRTALDIRRGSTRDSPRVTIHTLVALGQLLLPSDTAAAMPLLREAHTIAVERLEPGDPVRSRAAIALSLGLAVTGSSAEAAPVFEAALRALRERIGQEHPDTRAACAAARAAGIDDGGTCSAGSPAQS